MSLRCAAALALLLLHAGASSGDVVDLDAATCAVPGGCAASSPSAPAVEEDEGDEDSVAALHTSLRKRQRAAAGAAGAAAAAAAAEQSEPEDPEWPTWPSQNPELKPGMEWRDALTHELEHGAWLQAEIEKGGKGNFWPPPSRKLIAPNAQAPPQTGMEGPYQMTPYVMPPYPPSEELLQMPVTQSSNGLLDTKIYVDWGWVEFPKLGFRIKTRLYNGTYPGPTLLFRRGDHLRIKVINRLGRELKQGTRFQRREGQATYSYMNGIPANDPQYQDVGQGATATMMAGVPDNLHDPNTTNFHTHGLHVPCVQPQDEIFLTKIGPCRSWQYEYDVSPYHSGGSSWYHPHWHGAATLQTSQGMIGAMLIEDSPGELPAWLEPLRQVTALVHETTWTYFGPDYLKYAPADAEQGCFPFGATFSTQCALGHRTGILANLSGDRLWRMEYLNGFGYRVNETNPTTEFFSVNGQYRPTIFAKTGEWIRIRVIFGSANFPINMIFNTSQTGSPQDACDMYLLAKDNAYLSELPRKLKKGIFLAAGNRGQILIRCKKAGSYPLQNNITAYSFSALDPFQIFMFVNVTGPDMTNLTEPNVSKIPKPRYLNDLVNVPSANLATPLVPPAVNHANGQPLYNSFPLTTDPDNKTIQQFMTYDFPNGSPGRNPIPPSGYVNQPVRFSISNMTFNLEYPFAFFPVANVISIKVLGLDAHSWHMHTNPVQYVDFGFSDYMERWGGYYQIGDWSDTLQLVADTYDVTRGTQSGNYTATVRFQTDCYTGRLVVHCHVLYHEDLGMMTFFNATGKEFTYNDNFTNQGIFANPPVACTKPGQKCAPPYCSNYKYA